MGDIAFTVQTEGRLDSVVGAEPSLVKELQGFSRSQAALAIEAGDVFLNDRQIFKSSYKAKIGDSIRFVLREKSVEHLPYEKALEVFFEDESLIVINKPAGLSVHPGAGNPDTTLVNALVHHYSNSAAGLPSVFEANKNERVGIVHRLDKDTSGVLVVAKTLEVLQHLQKQFQEHTVDRRYVALCVSSPRSGSPLGKTKDGVIEGIIRRNPHNRKAFELVKSSDAGKFSKTYWSVQDRFSYGFLVSCKLATGRTHQIRVHFRTIGSPVAGDKTYTGEVSHLPKTLQVACDRFGRQALHAQSLAFIHPISGKELRFESPLPEDMTKLIQIFKDFKGTT